MKEETFENMIGGTRCPGQQAEQDARLHENEQTPGLQSNEQAASQLSNEQEAILLSDQLRRRQRSRTTCCLRKSFCENTVSSATTSWQIK